jgi:hypothetical protein
MSPEFVGVDWSSGVWVAVACDDEREVPEVFIFEEILKVWQKFGELASRDLVDTPVRLCESPKSNDLHV